jgi:DNA-binding transcriptional LysR family regulator
LRLIERIDWTLIPVLARLRFRVLELQQLETFRMVAERQNFTRAAAELGYSQPTVTTQIKALERELGAALFVRWRFSRNVVLTEVGRRTLGYAVRLLNLAAEAKAAVHQDAACQDFIRSV